VSLVFPKYISYWPDDKIINLWGDLSNSEIGKRGPCVKGILTFQTNASSCLFHWYLFPSLFSKKFNSKIQFLLLSSLITEWRYWKTQNWKPVFREKRREWTYPICLLCPRHSHIRSQSFFSFSPHYSLNLGITPSFKLKRQPLWGYLAGNSVKNNVSFYCKGHVLSTLSCCFDINSL